MLGISLHLSTTWSSHLRPPPPSPGGTLQHNAILQRRPNLARSLCLLFELPCQCKSVTKGSAVFLHGA